MSKQHKHNRLAEAALVATLAVTGVTGGAQVANAQQTRPSPTTTSADSPAYKGLVPDPNLPLNGLETDKISVAYTGGDPVPMIRLKGPMNRLNSGASYLGYNSEGSWVSNPVDGKIYVYNLSKNSLNLKYNQYNEIPKPVLATLRNPAKEQQMAQAKANPQPTEQVAQAPAPKPDGSKSILGDPTKGLQGLLAQAMNNRNGQQAGGTLPEGAGLNGSNAKIQGGVLSFTTSDGKSTSYKVVRPKTMGNNPQAAAAAGNTGTWVSMESNGNGIMFTVLDGGAVTGKEFPAQVMQMLMGGGPQR